LASYIEMAPVFFHSELFKSMALILWGRGALQKRV